MKSYFFLSEKFNRSTLKCIFSESFHLCDKQSNKYQLNIQYIENLSVNSDKNIRNILTRCTFLVIRDYLFRRNRALLIAVLIFKRKKKLLKKYRIAGLILIFEYIYYITLLHENRKYTVNT